MRRAWFRLKRIAGPGAETRQSSSLGTANTAILVFLAVTAALSAWSAARERDLLGLADNAGMARQALSENERDTVRGAAADCALTSNTRQLEQCLALHAELARQELRVGPRDASIAIAQKAAADLLRRLPRVGDAFALSAYLDATFSEGRTPGRALNLLARSYRLQPFSRKLGLWRIGFAARRWTDLDAETQLALLNEALWYSRIGRDDTKAVLGVLAGTEPYAAIAIRLSQPRAANLPFPAASE